MSLTRPAVTTTAMRTFQIYSKWTRETNHYTHPAAAADPSRPALSFHFSVRILHGSANKLVESTIHNCTYCADVSCAEFIPRTLNEGKKASC